MYLGLQNLEGFEEVGQTFGFESGASIGDMEMKMRLGAVAGIADQAEHLSTTDLVADFHRRLPGCMCA
jgi:hypothetical protein